MEYFIFLTNGYTQVGPLPAGQTAQEVAERSGITDPSLYSSFDTSSFPKACLNFGSAFTLVSGVVGFDLAFAKAQSSLYVKAKAATEQAAALSGYTPEVLASQGALPEIDRLPEMQAVIDAVNVLAVDLSSNLAAIVAATTIDEVNNIAYPPTGILFTGRDSGLGPEDLNVSYYTEFNSVSMAESDTELYVPGTDTVIAYGSGGPGQFDSAGDCFNPGGPYTMQIRETATSRVIAEFECPLAPANVDVAF